MELSKAILKYSEEDEVCKKTFEIFLSIYARCARNFALETLAFGGIYIAGGIAQKNINWFKKGFFIEESIGEALWNLELQEPLQVYCSVSQKDQGY